MDCLHRLEKFLEAHLKRDPHEALMYPDELSEINRKSSPWLWW
jgi:hypothetical protein